MFFYDKERKLRSIRRRNGGKPIMINLFFLKTNSFTSLIVRNCGLVLLLIVLQICGCQNYDDRTKLKEIQDKHTPLWSVKALEANKYTGATINYENTINQRPPFYNGSMPLKFESTNEFYPVPGFPDIPLVYRFDSHENYFIYHDMRLVGVMAIQDKMRLAEAGIKNVSVNGKNAIIMEEFHYDDIKLTYMAQSEIDPNNGKKIKEFVSYGNKKQEFFFIIPMGQVPLLVNK